ncbi:MAG: hypothetical protein DWQ36_08380 [Acidobacteria bacterium]|nr:MAG: hypothetical protein DWQ30_02105 [Acidobacteriota bacterium]REK08823.1 MAG: hypothetical protein DWQ36_08380 [Acidobacteriota bacterium]
MGRSESSTLATRYHLGFFPLFPYNLTSVREFYGKWAEEHSWRLIQPEEESWSHDSWQSFKDMDGRELEQLLVHWVSPDGVWSLRLALRSFGPALEENRAFAIVEPFSNLEDQPLY